jgi:hypothetical protein
MMPSTDSRSVLMAMMVMMSPMRIGGHRDKGQQQKQQAHSHIASTRYAANLIHAANNQRGRAGESLG